MAECVSDCVGYFKRETIINKLFPTLKLMVSDTSESVRISLSSKINSLALYLGKTDCIEYLFPLQLELLRDESSDV